MGYGESGRRTVADQPVTVVAAVIRREGLFLVARRPPHKRHGGLWEFPGGKVADAETLIEAARRELAEELGVRVVSATTASRFTLRDPGSHFVIEFANVEIEGEPQPLEHTALAWASIAELASYELAPSDRAFVASLHSPGATA